MAVVALNDDEHLLSICVSVQCPSNGLRSWRLGRGPLGVADCGESVVRTWRTGGEWRGCWRLRVR